MAYAGLGDLIPLYGLYVLLFADTGLSTAQISSLLFLWSGTAFVLEVPSGAWADTVSRRVLLVLGSILTAAGFLTWTVTPSYWGFAVGFVLWGAGGSLHSGTFQALLYDELSARGTARSYPGILGFATSATQGGALVGIVAGAPLYAWGGYDLVGWTSVGVVLCQAAIALTLPSAPRTVSVLAGDDLDPVHVVGADSPFRTYLSMLRSGTTEALRHPIVRRGVMLASALFGFTAVDEYFGLLAGENGTPTATVPLLVGLAVAGSLIGSLLAGRTASMRSSAMARALVAAGVLLAIGAAIGDAGLLGWVGFGLIGVGYGIVTNAAVVSEARLQGAIEGAARATVTSMAGLLSELIALLIFGAVALLSGRLSISAVMVVLAIPVVLTATVVRRWLPPHAADDGDL